jgi:hypothetical protein
MTDDELRAIVRDVVAKRLAHPAAFGIPTGMQGPRPLAGHPSFFRYPVASGDDQDGPCLIEPGVRCNHCGYCQSHGH